VPVAEYWKAEFYKKPMYDSLNILKERIAPIGKQPVFKEPLECTQFDRH
jgi:hypothetical protein